MIFNLQMTEEKNTVFAYVDLTHSRRSHCTGFRTMPGIPIISRGNSLKWLFFLRYYIETVLVTLPSRRQYPLCKFPFHNVSRNKFLILFAHKTLNYTPKQRPKHHRKANEQKIWKIWRAREREPERGKKHTSKEWEIESVYALRNVMF